MKLGLKLLLAPLLVGAVSLCAGVVYAVIDYREGLQSAAADERDIGRIKVAGQMKEELSQMRGSVYRTLVLIASLDEAKIKSARAELKAQGETVKAQTQRLAADTGGDAASQQFLARVAERLGTYLKRCDESIDSSSLDPNMGAGMMRGAEDIYAQLAADMQGLVARADALRAERVDRSEREQRQLQIGLVAALLAAGAGAAFVSWRIQRRILGALRQAEDLGNAVAGGDLAAAAGHAGRTGDDEIGDLTRGLLRMVQGLDASLQTVRQASDHIGVASSEIASGNLDLSGRTEQTAGNLQQAASSLEQLTGTVRQTADSARTANQLANSASTVAQRGGQVVAQVVATMDEISASSRRIADIIGTIDGIAFQTNILALNAAVEAARAGEQGRGFAVVASEVRSLAGRSAEAAREIKSLIGASVEKVESGSRLVADAGSTMGELVAGVQRVNDIIAEISAAAAEQSAGLGQVNGAVTELDRMTQQNAALVEQSAAAAQSLREQAGRLTDVVGRFRLVSGGTDGSAPARLAAPMANHSANAAARPPSTATAGTTPATATPAAMTRSLLAQVKQTPASLARTPRPASSHASARSQGGPPPAGPTLPLPPSPPIAPNESDWESF